MSYVLRDLDDVPGSVRRCAAERLQHAATVLEERGEDDRAGAIHAARKDLKKTRSLLRLLRPVMPRKAYRRRNDALRVVARSLAGARDADARAEAVLALHEHAAGRLPEHAFRELADAARASDSLGDGPDLAGVGAKLRALAHDVDAWPVDDATSKTLAAGMADAYERGLQALEQARADPSSEALHEWRKRVKDLWYHARLIKPAAPRALKGLAKDASELADVLGDEHDLAQLVERLEDPQDPIALVAVDAEELQATIRARREALRAQATALAAQVYAERPKAFRRRVARLTRRDRWTLALR